MAYTFFPETSTEIKKTLKGDKAKIEDIISVFAYIKQNFPNMINGAWRNKIQFGGSYWIYTGMRKHINFSPLHYCRFKEIENNKVNWSEN